MSDNTENTATDFRSGSLDPKDWSAKVTYRGRNRMKIMFKLSQDESAAYTHFQNQTKPEGISEEAFIKSIFFLGLTTLETNITKKITEKLEEEGGEVEFPEDTRPMGEILDLPDDPEDSSDQE